jgi:enoyl-CoA hydratase/carnithine racemase
MWKEIGEAFNLLGTTGDGCRCILLTGSGKGFCGGIDLTDEKFFSGISPDNIDEDDNDAAITKRQDAARTSFAFKPQILQMQAAFTAVEQCTVPVVAAIHGACVGAGVDLACCADIRVCSPNATFSVREARLGLAADVGTLQRLPKLVGFGSRVRELCLTGGELVNYTFHLVVVCNIFFTCLCIIIIFVNNTQTTLVHQMHTESGS